MKIFAALGFILALSCRLSAQTLYVNGGCGDDAWSGLSPDCVAPDGPKRTIQTAIPSSGTDARIVVAPGFYAESVNASRPAPDYVHWRLVIETQAGAGGQETIVDAQGGDVAIQAHNEAGGQMILRGITFQNASSGIRNTSINVELIDCIVRNCYYGLRPTSGVTAAD